MQNPKTFRVCYSNEYTIKEVRPMPTILRITNAHALRSSDPKDHTLYIANATHQYFSFVEYRVLDNRLWREERAWAGTVSVAELYNLLYSAGLLREITASKQSGGESHDTER